MYMSYIDREATWSQNFGTEPTLDRNTPTPGLEHTKIKLPIKEKKTEELNTVLSEAWKTLFETTLDTEPETSAWNIVKELIQERENPQEIEKLELALLEYETSGTLPHWIYTQAADVKYAAARKLLKGDVTTHTRTLSVLVTNKENPPSGETAESMIDCIYALENTLTQELNAYTLLQNDASFFEKIAMSTREVYLDDIEHATADEYFSLLREELSRVQMLIPKNEADLLGRLSELETLNYQVSQGDTNPKTETYRQTVANQLEALYAKIKELRARETHLIVLHAKAKKHFNVGEETPEAIHNVDEKIESARETVDAIKEPMDTTPRSSSFLRKKKKTSITERLKKITGFLRR